MESLKNTIEVQDENKRIGSNFLGILNDIKRRPEDAARELGIDVETINAIISGEIKLPAKIVEDASKIWPVNQRDFYIIRDDCPSGVKIMRAGESEKSSRIMKRAGEPYYEYRDTVSSVLAPFRPEWIMELCSVIDNDPNNSRVQWNNGHFMHQFTYFIGHVNFYYKNSNGEKQVAIMNTGDSMYITPFTPHTFATRIDAKQNGLILALTFGNKISGDAKQELSSISTELGQEYVLDFSTKEQTISSLLKFHREMCSISVKEISKRTDNDSNKINNIENNSSKPSEIELNKLANALDVNIRDIIANDIIEKKVIIKQHNVGKKWFYPENSPKYEFLELAGSRTLPYSKAYEVNVTSTMNNTAMDLKAGLHQYVYNIGDSNISLSWILNNKQYTETIHPGDSVYTKPFLPHNFRGSGKLLVLRLGGKIVGDSQRELSIIGKENVKRAIDESIQWFNPEGRTNID